MWKRIENRWLTLKNSSVQAQGGSYISSGNSKDAQDDLNKRF